jgi:hypothetical protein
MRIWAVKELGATSTQLSYGYLLMPPSAGSSATGRGICPTTSAGAA